MQALKQSKAKDGEDEDEERVEDDDEEFHNGELDAYGNKLDEELLEDNEMNDAYKVKENLRNSSKIYYKITHSIQEEITQ